jgi:hypothetical protein
LSKKFWLFFSMFWVALSMVWFSVDLAIGETGWALIWGILLCVHSIMLGVRIADYVDEEQPEPHQHQHQDWPQDSELEVVE